MSSGNGAGTGSASTSSAGTGGASTSSASTGSAGTGGASTGSAGTGGSAPSCTDGVKNGNETDVDCGGGTCPPCADGMSCTVGAGCKDGVCTGGTCAMPRCMDGVKNGNETDVDCGGGTCPACADGKGCIVGADCKDLVCDSTTHTCSAPTCSDNVKNGNETDVDCGGSCPPCATGKLCGMGSDCTSALCLSGTCQACSTTVPCPTGQSCAGGTCTVTQPPTGPAGVCAVAAVSPVDERLYILTFPGALFSKALNDTAWTKLTGLPTDVTNGTGTGGPDGAFYAFGRFVPYVGSTHTSYRYDPGTHTWSGLSLPTDRMLAAAAPGPDGKIYVMGGERNNGNGIDAYWVVGTLEAYDPVAKKWTTGLPDMPTPRHMLSAVLGPDKKIYAIGGSTTASEANSYPPTTAVHAYDPVANKWTAVAPLMTARTRAAVAVGADGLIYVMGGQSGTSALSSVEAYDPNAPAKGWVPKASMPKATVCAGGAAPQGADPVFAVMGTAAVTQTYLTATSAWAQ